MKSTKQSSLEALSNDQLRQIEAICTSVEEEWQQGSSPKWDIFLHEVGEESRLALKEELVRIELCWRSKRGEKVSLQDYSKQYPEMSESLPEWLEEAHLSTKGSADSMTNSETLSHIGEPPTPLRLPAEETIDHGDASPMPLTLGEYAVLEKLGAGGMGEVYLAEHQRLKRRVALKTIRLDKQSSKLTLARFEREIRAAGQLDSPHLVAARDASEQDGVVYLVLEYVEGDDLSEYVKKHGPLSPVEACELTRQAAIGLQHLHEKGMVHRDIKPSNLRRTPEGQLKVLDLGLARWQAHQESEESLTGRGSYMGTPDYMAPEQIDAVSEVDIRADLYGLGGVLYFLLTAHAPFANVKGLQQKLTAHLTKGPKPMTDYRPDIPGTVIDLVDQLLAKKPEERFTTPEELVEKLEQLITELKTGEAKPADLGKGKRRRIPAAMMLGVGLVAAGIVAVLLISSFNKKDESQHIVNRDKKLIGGTGQQTVPPKKLKILVKGIIALHREVVEGKNDYKRGELGKKSFVTHNGDGLDIEFQLTAPAYCYIIAYYPNGQECLAFPENENEAPPMTDKPKYPWKDASLTWGLTDGEGLQSFFVVVSSNPLPPYSEWKSKRGNSPWKPMDIKEEIIYFYYDDQKVSYVTTTERGPAQKKVGPDVLMLEQGDWLHKAPEIETVAGIGFTVLPKKRE